MCSSDLTFFSTTGNLWKANWGASFKDASTSNMGIEDVTLTYTNTPIYDYKGSKSNLEIAKTQLADFITNVNSKNGLHHNPVIVNLPLK